MSVKNQLFEEIFSPKTLKSFVLPKRIKDEFSDKEGNLLVGDNYLFYGTSGLGKSSLAILLATNYNMFYMNASLDGGIDSLRRGSELYDFCVRNPLMADSKTKVVVLDELNGVSKQFFEALKGFITEFTRLGIRFIGTTNYIEDIEPAILSRLKPINFNMSAQEEVVHKAGYTARVKAILSKIDVTHEEEALSMLINKSYPDWRGTLSDLQFLHRAGKKEITEDVVKKDIYMYNDIFDLIATKSSIKDLRFIMDTVRAYNNPTNVIKGIERDIFDYYTENNPKMLILVPTYIILVAKYSDMMNRRVDPSLCFKALVFELIKAREQKAI